MVKKINEFFFMEEVDEQFTEFEKHLLIGFGSVIVAAVGLCAVILISL